MLEEKTYSEPVVALEYHAELIEDLIRQSEQKFILMGRTLLSDMLESHMTSREAQEAFSWALHTGIFEVECFGANDHAVYLKTA